MTLRDIVYVLEGVAGQQPAVRTIVRHDVSKLSDRPDIPYGVFAWQHGVHRESAAGDMVRYSFTLFYVDRLTPDKVNELDAEATGCEVLGSILRFINEEVDGIQVQDWTLHPFQYRFKDECAGCWAEVSMDVPTSLPCGAVYEEIGSIVKELLIF